MSAMSQVIERCGTACLVRFDTSCLLDPVTND
jgi:hypothetical protein